MSVDSPGHFLSLKVAFLNVRLWAEDDLHPLNGSLL